MLIVDSEMHTISSNCDTVENCFYARTIHIYWIVPDRRWNEFDETTMICQCTNNIRNFIEAAQNMTKREREKKNILGIVSWN